MKTIRIFGFLWAVLFATSLMAQGSPVVILEQASKGIINTLDSNKSELKTNKNIIRQAVKKYLLPVVDVRGMSRSVLGRNAWKKATPSERKAFTRAFTDLVIRTYANPLAKYDGDTIKFYPVRGGLDRRFVKVKSIITRKSGQKIPLSYSLVAKKGGWKVFDLSVEGVSLIQSFRSQFAQALQNSNINTVIKEMQRKG